MKLYAFKGEPGCTSIWGLRGSRSPISAIETRKPKRIKRAIGKYFDALKEEKILDHLLIYDEQKNLVYHFGAEEAGLKNNIQLDWGTALEPIVFAGIDSKIAVQIAFPIFSNGRKVGTIVYAKELDEALLVLSTYDEGPDLVLFYKYLLVLNGDTEYTLHFNETDELSASQRHFVEQQYAQFKAWWAQWDGTDY